ncbi:hypothetical protein ZWY2020_022065 [Hordeum vulgare]|nr:hypothetical protein ZWY2020_022065 [Hordeum vulgare]
MSALLPMIHVQGAQAKKRKTGDLSSAPKTTDVLGVSISAPELDEEPSAAHDDPADDIADVRHDSPGPLKETTDNVNPPSSSKVTEDPDTVIITGPRAANLQDDCILKLKAIYTFTEQLYTRSMLTMKAVMGNKEPIKSTKNMLGCLSMLPPQVEELKRSAACKGALTTLSRCLAYASELKPEEVVAGYPELKDDESEFTEDDYHRVVKESRAAATQLAASLDLNKYQAAYDVNNKKVTPPSFGITSVTPRRPKNPFDFEANLFVFLNDEDESVALSKCNWKFGDLQIEDGESSRQGDPEAA